MDPLPTRLVQAIIGGLLMAAFSVLAVVSIDQGCYDEPGPTPVPTEGTPANDLCQVVSVGFPDPAAGWQSIEAAIATTLAAGVLFLPINRLARWTIFVVLLLVVLAAAFLPHTLTRFRPGG